MKRKYAICALVNEAKTILGKKGHYPVQKFFGIDHLQMSVFVYEDEPTENTKLFNTKKEANAYIRARLDKRLFIEAFVIVPLTIYEEEN